MRFVQWDLCVKAHVDNLRRNILKDRKSRQQVDDPAGVVHPPTALPERPRSPVFKRNRDQPMPCAPDNTDNPSIVSYMHKWQVADFPVFHDDVSHLTI